MQKIGLKSEHLSSCRYINSNKYSLKFEETHAVAGAFQKHRATMGQNGSSGNDLSYKCSLDAKAITPEVRGGSRKYPKRSTGAILMSGAGFDAGICILTREPVQMSSVLSFTGVSSM